VWADDFAYRSVDAPAALVEAFARLVGQLGDVAGFVWTQLTDVEGELNGLLTYDRLPKAPPEEFRKILDSVTRASRSAGHTGR